MVNPRMFEVFATMSKTIGELNKQLIQTVEAIKETYKTFKEDVKEKRTEAMGPTQGTSGMITTGDGGVVTRGTKELINKVKEIKKINVFIDPSSNFIDEAGLIPNIINDTPDITTKTIEL
jgi:heptaprenylglyceryl phosphate synthase